jgi:hypothetical protein
MFELTAAQGDERKENGEREDKNALTARSQRSPHSASGKRKRKEVQIAAWTFH